MFGLRLLLHVKNKICLDVIKGLQKTCHPEKEISKPRSFFYQYIIIGFVCNLIGDVNKVFIPKRKLFSAAICIS